MMDNSLQSNIWKIILSESIYTFGVINSVRVLFFNTLNYTPFHLAMYEVITSIAIVASDLFTGVIADRLGRRNSVFISNLAFLTMSIILGTTYWISRGFWIILIICGILNGLEFSFRSGAKSALLYDSLVQLHRENEYLKINGRMNAYTIASNVVGMLIGGFLFDEMTILPFWIWFFFILAASIILLTVQEPINYNSEKNSFWTDVKFGVKYIFNSKSLLWLSLFFLYFDVFAETYWDTYSQTHMETLIEIKVGVIFGIIGGFSALASYFIEKIEKTIGRKGMLYGIVGIQVVLFLGIAWAKTWYLLAILLLFLDINRNVGYLLSDAYKNKLIPSEHRAAVLSADSFLHNGLFGGGLIILGGGLLIDKFTDYFGILFTIFAVLILVINGSLLLGRDLQKQRKQRID